MDQSGDPMCPRGPVATDGHRNNEYPGLRRVADPVYPRERRPCGLDVDEQVLGTHYRLHTHKSRVRDSSAARTSGGRRNLSLHATTKRYRRHARVPLMVRIMAIARGGLSWEIKGAPNPHSSIAILSLGKL